MPKISELAAAAALTGTEQVPLVQSGVTKRTTVGAMGSGNGYYNVKTYGAIGDGVSNDTTAIQAAIDAAQAAGGGVVFIPPGTYRVQPATISTGFALTITGNNVTILGAGHLVTKLKFYLYDGSAATGFPIVAGQVLRGHGFLLPGPTQTDISFIAFEYDGGAGNTGNRSFPASIVNGDGWDLTHKCLAMQAGYSFDNIVVKDCNWHTWRGEVIYYGGTGLASLHCLNSIIGDTNADGISVSCTEHIVDTCEIYSCYNAATESAYYGGRQVYRHNLVRDCHFGGIQSIPADDSVPIGTAEIYSNEIVRCSTASSVANYHAGARNMRIYDNLFVDCPGFNLWLQSPGGGGSGTDTIVLDNVEVWNNRFIADTVNINTMIYVQTDGNLSRLHIHNNIGAVTLTGVLSGLSIRRCINIDENSTGNFGGGCRIWENMSFTPSAGAQDRHDQWKTENFAVTTGGVFPVRVRERRNFLRRVNVHWKIATAATDVAVYAGYFNAAGATKLILLSNVPAQPIGDYCATAFVSPGEYSSSGECFVYIEVSANGRVTLDAEITD